MIDVRIKYPHRVYVYLNGYTVWRVANSSGLGGKQLVYRQSQYDSQFSDAAVEQVDITPDLAPALMSCATNFFD